jgi:hypothetical protein
MGVSLDGQSLFDEEQFEIELSGFSRDSVERVVPGLDGVLSVDLGGRGRKIKQKGVLRAKSRLQMDRRFSAISDYVDGKTHTLVTSNGEEYDNLRMDVFRVCREHATGSGIAVDYEIVYTQLKVQQ